MCFLNAGTPASVVLNKTRKKSQTSQLTVSSTKSHFSNINNVEEKGFMNHESIGKEVEKEETL
jgi:hypothetical protein